MQDGGLSALQAVFLDHTFSVRQRVVRGSATKSCNDRAERVMRATCFARLFSTSDAESMQAPTPAE
jgi:hypothetical protein